MNFSFIKKTIIFVIVLIGFFTTLIFLSSRLTITNYTYSSSRIPREFDGFKIVQLSDIHCKRFGQNNEELILAIKNLNPDIIVITGDTIDAMHDSYTAVDELFNGISSIAPIYSISGNHEVAAESRYQELLEMYEKYQIKNMDDAATTISIGDSSISIKGLGAFETKQYWDSNYLTKSDSSTFSILLDHYPDLDLIYKYQYDLLLSGHIHGGIIRIPFVGGLLGNNREFFPKYDGGIYQAENTTMILNRGLGDSYVPRINNNPEVVCITLVSEATQTVIVPTVEEPAKPELFTASDFTENVKAGWNLGNSLDSCVNENYRNDGTREYSFYETAWNNPEITKELIDTVKAAGFDSIRLPVTWYYNTYNTEDGHLKIYDNWLNRVATVVDYCIDNDLYVILDSHHDGPIIWNDLENIEQVSQNISDLWGQIADYFKDYDEHLLFESFNEINTNTDSWTYTEDNLQATNQLNQIFVDTIRSSGGNNASRILVCDTCLSLANDETLSGFVVPTDSIDNALLISVHYYSSSLDNDINTNLKKLSDFSKKAGAPVIITECGTTTSFSPISYRSLQAGHYAFYANKYNIPFYWWDDGGNYKLINREDNTILEPEIIDSLMHPQSFESILISKTTFSSIDDFSFSDAGVLIFDINRTGLEVTPNNRYYIKLQTSDDGDGLRICSVDFYSSSNELISTQTVNTSAINVLAPDEAAYLQVSINNPWGYRSLEEYNAYLEKGYLLFTISEYDH